MRTGWICGLALVLAGCGGGASSAVVTDAETDPISDANSPKLAGAELTEFPHAADSNGISLSALSGDGKVVATVNSTGPGTSYCALSTLSGSRLSLPSGFDPAGRMIASLSSNGSAFVCSSPGLDPKLYSSSGDQSIDSPGVEMIRSLSAISGDGKTVLGTQTNGVVIYPFRWSAEGGFATLYPFISDIEFCHGLSQDGRFAVGGDSVAHRWDASGAEQQVGPLGYRRTSAWAISADGGSVVGAATSSTTSHYVAYRWTLSGGAKRLGHYPGFDNSAAKFMAADGKLVVGEVWGPAPATPFVWTSNSGMRLLRDLATGSDPVLLSESGPVRVNGLSEDGKTIIGGTYDRTGSFPEHAWVAKIALR